MYLSAVAGHHAMPIALLFLYTRHTINDMTINQFILRGALR